MTIDRMAMDQARRGAMRWHLLAALGVARPQGMYTEGLLPIIQSVYPDATHLEVRRELDYLAERELVRIAKDPMDRWMAGLTRHGVDLVDYTTACEPGITRPTITRV